MRRTNPPSRVLGRPPKSWWRSDSSSMRSHQHGQPVPGGEHRLERIGAGAGRAQHETGELRRREHVELVIAAAQPGLDPRAQRRSARRGGDEQADALRIAALRHQPAKARLDHPRLARPGRSENHDTRHRNGWRRRAERSVSPSSGRSEASAVGEQAQALDGLARVRSPGSPSDSIGRRMGTTDTALDADWLGLCRRSVDGLAERSGRHPDDRRARSRDRHARQRRRPHARDRQLGRVGRLRPAAGAL